MFRILSSVALVATFSSVPSVLALEYQQMDTLALRNSSFPTERVRAQRDYRGNDRLSSRFRRSQQAAQTSFTTKNQTVRRANRNSRRVAKEAALKRSKRLKAGLLRENGERMTRRRPVDQTWISPRRKTIRYMRTDFSKPVNRDQSKNKRRERVQLKKRVQSVSEE